MTFTPPASPFGNDAPVLTEALRLHHAGQLDEAVALYLWLEARHPENARLKFNIGICHQQRRHWSAAVRALRAALVLEPTLIAALEILGEVMREQDRLPETEAVFRQALAMDVKSTRALQNLASVLKAQGGYVEAMSVILQSLKLDPDNAEAMQLVGALHYEQGDIDAALQRFRQVLALDATQAQAHFNLSQCLLLQGKFNEGWREHEWRAGTEALTTLERGFVQPFWKGEPLTGKTILLHAEQGLGDTLQYIRYAPLLKASGARVLLECQPLLLRLLQGAAGVDEVIARGTPLPPFDIHAPLMGLPYLFGTELESIPTPLPYLQVPENCGVDLAGMGLTRSGPAPARPRIGLCWAGNPGHSNDANRSIRLGLFEPLYRATEDQIDWVSLQFGARAAERRSYLWADNMLDATSGVVDFADSAALIAQLDLVISVDTSVAHLTGAMGRPVWALLPFVPDSRWLLRRADSPWYPSMRLFRQPKLGDWESVLAYVTQEITIWQTQYARGVTA